MPDAQIATDLLADSNNPKKRPRGNYWISDLIGANVYIRDDGFVCIERTLNRAAWTLVQAISAADPVINTWFDRLTPGDNGTCLYIAVSDIDATENNSLTVHRYDIATDVLTSLQFSADPIDGATAGNYVVKSISGRLEAGYNDVAVESESWYTDDFSSLTSTGSPYESAADDYIQGMHARTDDPNDVALLYIDISANAWSVKVKDMGAGTYAESTGGSVTDLATSGFYDVKTRLSVQFRDNILGIWNATDATTADYQIWSIAVTAVGAGNVTPAALANARTDSAESGCAGIFINQQTNAIRAYYARGTFAATVSIFYVESTDDGGSFGSEQAYSSGAADDYRAIDGGAMGAPWYGGVASCIFQDDDDNDLWWNSDNTVIPPRTLPGTPYGQSGQRQMRQLLAA